MRSCAKSVALPAFSLETFHAYLLPHILPVFSRISSCAESVAPIVDFVEMEYRVTPCWSKREGALNYIIEVYFSEWKGDAKHVTEAVTRWATRKRRLIPDRRVMNSSNRDALLYSIMSGYVSVHCYINSDCCSHR